MQKTMTNRDACRILNSLFKAFVRGDDEMHVAYQAMLEECGDNRTNFLMMFDVMGGAMTGVMAAISAHEEMNFDRVVDDVFNDAYADMLDLAIALDIESEKLDEEIARGVDSTRTSEGTNPVDRELGDGEVDGLE